MLLRGAPRASGMRRVVGVMACRGKSGVASSPAVVQVERRPDGIAHVVLSRPSKMNALSMDMFRSIRDAAKSLIADSSVRVVVISGEGRACRSSAISRSEVCIFSMSSCSSSDISSWLG